PGGAGSAPGNHFAVPGLQALPGAPGGLPGEIVFPTKTNAAGKDELREDVDDRQLGMPRDLSGDYKVDDQDHSKAYLMLPFLVRVRWSSPNGEREYRLATQICQYRKE